MDRIPAAGARRIPGLIVGSVVVALLVLSVISGFLVDVLWFGEVGFSDTFWSLLSARGVLALAAAGVFFALLVVNLLVARRLSPSVRATFPAFDPIERYRAVFEPYATRILIIGAAVIALSVGIGASTEWRAFLLWRHSGGVTFGATDPLFGRDAAYYVFSLPWLRFVQSWLFSSLVGVTILTAVAHLLFGGIRPQAPILGEKLTPQVKAHLSVLLGLVVLIKAWGYVLGQHALVNSPRGVVSGASYTDVNAQLPALQLLAVVAVVCAVLFLVNIRLRGWALPVFAVGLLALVSVVAGAAYPAFVQRFRVAPQELQRESVYIEDNIAATREAFGLDAITSVDRTVDDAGVPADVIEREGATLASVRVWRPEVLLRGIQSLQRVRPYYEFSDVDVDRYEIDGQRQVVLLSVREMAQSGIPGGGGTWQNRHLVFTHGYGAVAARVNASTGEGAPAFTLLDIPARGEPALTPEGQRVYYGELSDVPFVVVGTGTEELDYQGTAEDEQAQATTVYDGDGGISVGSLARRVLFAWRFRDINLLISDLIRPESRIMIYRDIDERVPRAAPFLTYDSDPYAAVVDGRLVWIWDAYTTTDAYPYSQPVALEEVTSGSVSGPSPAGTVNYIRNSVKVVVDAYDGSITYYVVDDTDPIIRVWRAAFPDLFTDGDEAPASLREHFRYPENLFQVQAAQYARYHVTDPSIFYGNQDSWQVAADPTIAEFQGTAFAMRPYYMLLRLPGEAEEGFVLMLPMTPQGRQNMVAWMVARSDVGDGYGEILSYEFPAGATVDGPTQVFARINQDQQFASERTLLGQSGSTVEFGDFLVIPLGGSLLYVQPVYVSSASNAIPELKRVVVVNGGRIGIGSTFPQALAETLDGVVVPPDGGDGEAPTPPSGDVDEQIRALLEQAAERFAAADAALRAGDLARYEAEIAAARALIEQALALGA